jgi:hypothetical protein
MSYVTLEDKKRPSCHVRPNMSTKPSTRKKAAPMKSTKGDENGGGMQTTQIRRFFEKCKVYWIVVCMTTQHAFAVRV